MKSLTFLLLFFLIAGVTFSQSTEKEKTKPTKTELPEKAEKGVEISQKATSTEGGKEKGISISSAARKSTLIREKAEKKGNSSEPANEKAKLGAGNAERGKEISNQAKSRTNNKLNIPGQITRPNITVPRARPTPPVVRPSRPDKPGKPVTPPGGI
ncbi:hypothetical protein Belba_0750 [Belliella baltica DSM 15883]|uniref:Uncharacterized protein n=1 Tax=Belliella baltica (strain DSM 15883 / CIP 108006 / LMG 21964 / BA134) TaxID=866536 RepID=I3Z2D4_BELBD|nr:hypothetical protein [Belliella baltica]AFL83402.1 hypothetical protein Belba_0750 [Belliella baltica DSM 15883]